MAWLSRRWIQRSISTRSAQLKLFNSRTILPMMAIPSYPEITFLGMEMQMEIMRSTWLRSEHCSKMTSKLTTSPCGPASILEAVGCTPAHEGAINGSYGACVDRGTNDKRKQLIDETPIDKTSYLVRFNIDLNGLSMSEGERFRFAQVKMGAERPFVVVLRYLGGQHEIMLKTLLDDLSKPSTSWYPLSAGPHTIEVDWGAAGAPSSNDGYTDLYIDDVLQEALSYLDNDTVFIDTLKLGFTSRLGGKSISGVFYIDDVATSQFGHIGLP